MQNRRSFIARSAMAAASGMLLTSSVTAPAAKKRVLRFAHITDVHVMDQPHVVSSFSTVMSEINSMKDKPDIILNTGDSVRDMNNQIEQNVQSHWNAWDKCVRNNSIPMYSCIGNHDVWYVRKEDETDSIRANKRYRKAWVISKLQMPSRYYSFRKGNWTFIALDSIRYNDIGYEFDSEQLAWLDNELAAAGDTPVCILSHVPVMSFTPLMYLLQSGRTALPDVRFPSGDLHTDVVAVKNILYKHKNVKLALSGHVHYIDMLDYLGTKFICGGAVSSNWWDGVLEEFPHAYGISDLYDDGTFDYRIVFYPATKIQ